MLGAQVYVIRDSRQFQGRGARRGESDTFTETIDGSEDIVVGADGLLPRSWSADPAGVPGDTTASVDYLLFYQAGNFTIGQTHLAAALRAGQGAGRRNT